jgi:pyruvate carboxylase
LHPHLAGGKARLIGEGTIRGRLFDLGEYPGAIADSKRFSTVRGEVHELLAPAETLAVLDDVEGYDAKRPERSLFIRKTVEVKLDGGRAVEAWVYFYARALGEALEIPDGDFARYTAE